MRLRTVSVLLVICMFLGLSVTFQQERPQLALAQSSFRAPPPIEWSKNYGLTIWSLAQMADGGYTLLGENSTRQAWLIRTDVSGNMLWNKTYKPAPGTEIYSDDLSGTASADGGYVIAMRARAWMVKTDALGSIEWNKTYAGGDGHERASSVHQTSDGGYVLAGWTDAYVLAHTDFWLVKIDAGGNAVWNKTYGEKTSDEMAYSVDETADGGYILVGETFPSGASWRDGWVVKTDQNGNMVWNETLGATEGDDFFFSVRQTSDGGYIMAGGYNRGTNAFADFWLVKTDSNGTVEWVKTYGETDRDEYANSVWETTDDGFIVAGGLPLDGGFWHSWLVRTDSYGNMIWNATYGSTAWTDVIQTTDGGYAFTGGGLTKLMRANPPVVAFVNRPSNASVQQEIVFNASASYDLDEDIVSYAWDFDDGNVSIGINPIISHSYESPQTYNVTLTITDSEGMNSSLSREVWVRVPTYIWMSIVDWAFIGFEIPVSGRLYDVYGNGLRNENVTLWWYIGGNTWTLLASDITDDFGYYVIDGWNPTAVRSYVVKVEWGGNQTFFLTESTRTIGIVSIPTRISLALSSSTSQIGFQVRISGDLVSDVRAVSNTPVLLSYSVTGGQTWIDMTLAYTESDGRYSGVWMPAATGNYLVKASWAGNSTYPKASKTVSLAVIPFEEQNVFLVISNSTVSELSFESAHKELTFTLEEASGTMGYADVYIAKTLIGSIEGVEVKLNGTEIEYTATSLDDSWLIHFTYPHSIHEVSIGLKTEVVDGRPSPLLYLIIAAAVIALIIGIAMIKLRKTKARRIESTK